MSQIKVKTVFKWFWKYTGQFRWSFFGILFVYIALYAMEAFIPLYYKDFFNIIATGDGSVDQRVPMLIRIVLAVGVFKFVRWILYRIGGSLVMNHELRVMQSMDEGSFGRILKHSTAFFADNFAGTLVRRAKRFSDAYEHIIDALVFSFIPIFASIGISLVILFLRNVWLGMGMLAALLVIIGINFIFAKWKLKYDHVRFEKDSRTSGAITDAFSNVLNIKVFAREAYEADRFRNIRLELTDARLSSWKVFEFGMGIQTLLMLAIEIAMMSATVYLWKNGRITLGDIVLVQSYILVLFDRLWNIGRVFRQVYESFADAGELVEILETPIGVPDLKKAASLKVSDGKVEFSNVEFSYHKTRKVIEHLSLTIKAGERVALVGSSGAGKSTMVKLLLRFADPSAGHILVDGQDIRRVTQESLRSNIAFVPQESVLFHRTLKENIQYAKLDATQEEIERASRLAHCHEFIEALPEKYETYVGERGVKLSGGERQRVAIARAILKNAPILVLDEATSSLDSESEALIQDALHTLMKGRTTIAIAHRLSTVMQMDRIIVLDGGKIVDEGTHIELLKRGGLYQRLWSIQAGGFA